MFIFPPRDIILWNYINEKMMIEALIAFFIVLVLLLALAIPALREAH